MTRVVALVLVVVGTGLGARRAGHRNIAHPQGEQRQMPWRGLIVDYWR